MLFQNRRKLNSQKLLLNTLNPILVIPKISQENGNNCLSMLPTHQGMVMVNFLLPTGKAGVFLGHLM